MNTPSQTDEQILHEQSLWDAIKILHGDGVCKYLLIESSETDRKAWVEVGEVNPLTMRLVSS